MLPITKIILYKHGVGYFERLGIVNGNAAVDLQFHANEMNDVLKSLTTLDLNGGIIASISYESAKTTTQQLKDVSVRLADKNSMSDLIRQIKGAKVKLVFAQNEIVGTVIGTESITKVELNYTIINDYIALLVDGAKITLFNLLEVNELVLLDEDLKRDLQHILDVLLSENKKEVKKLTIFAQGQGDRTLMASYIVESPIWKTSYRMLLHESNPIIQGWALVDNTQEEDWVNVSLSLVAGLPISFVHDLYSPRYKRRPVVEVQEEEAYAPPELEGVLDDYAMAGIASESDESFKELSKAMPMPVRSRSKKMDRMQASQSSVKVHTKTGEIGDLFQYEITHPVNVKRGQSALVPILQSRFEGKKIALYNPDVREKNPMSAVLFKNTTGLTLEGGPVTVMEEATYVGEAMLDTLQPNEEKITPYSVELGCIIAIDHHSKQEDVHFAQIVFGKIYFHRFSINETIYKIRNKTDREIDLYLDHRFHKGWNLIGENTAKEETENFYRFQVIVPANTTMDYVVKEKGDEQEYYNLNTVNLKNIQYWLKKKYIDEETRKNLGHVHEMTHKIGLFQIELHAKEDEVNEIIADQKRFRDNLKALRNNQEEGPLRERYISELSASEDRLKVLRDSIKTRQIQKTNLEEELNKLINSFKYENYC